MLRRRRSKQQLQPAAAGLRAAVLPELPSARPRRTWHNSVAAASRQPPDRPSWTRLYHCMYPSPAYPVFQPAYLHAHVRRGADAPPALSFLRPVL